MQLECIHFEEIFDVADSRGDFSFRSRGRAHYGACLRRGTVPRAGSTYLVAFARPGDWSSVLGWRETASQREVLSHSAWSLLLVRLLDIYWWAPAWLAIGFLLGGIKAGLACAAFFIAGMACASVHDVRTLRAVRQALLATDACNGGQDKDAGIPATPR